MTPILFVARFKTEQLELISSVKVLEKKLLYEKELSTTRVGFYCFEVVYGHGCKKGSRYIEEDTGKMTDGNHHYPLHLLLHVAK